jgi:hypothetical protein
VCDNFAFHPEQNLNTAGSRQSLSGTYFKILEASSSSFFARRNESDVGGQ